MEGLEKSKPKEKISERVREDDKKQKTTGSKNQGDTNSGNINLKEIGHLKIPTQRIMIRRIRKELHAEIKDLLKQSKSEEKKGAFYLNEIWEKIRELRAVLTGLATATYEVAKNLYVSLFEKKTEK